MNNKIKVLPINLGCDKNRADLEKMMSLVNSSFYYEITNDESNFNVVIINSCAFIADARRETNEIILEFYRKKKKNNNIKIIVSGCFPKIKDNYITKKQNKFVDVWIEHSEQANILPILNKLFGKNEEIIEKQKNLYTLSGSYHYLKICDGCNNLCSYCTIPLIKGCLHSVSIDKLVAEAKERVSMGITEIIIVGQDVLAYGQDFDNNTTILTLIKELEKIDNLKWIRVMYCYPDKLTDEIINYIAKSKKVCKYVDMPLQHISDRILKLMNRSTTKEQIISRIQKLKEKNIAIRSTFIVGFPTETEEEFEELLHFLKKYQLDEVGFFKYSREKNTRAYDIKPQVGEKIKQVRIDNAYRVQECVATENNQRRIGKTLEAVCIEQAIDGKKHVQDEYGRYLYVFRTSMQCPDIDSEVKVYSKDLLEINKYYILEMNCDKSYNYLIGEVKTKL